MTHHHGVPKLPDSIRPQSRGVLADPGLAADFRRDGFVKATLVSPAVVMSLKDELDALRPLAAAPHGTVMGGTVDYHCSAMDPDVVYRRQLNAIIRARIGDAATAMFDGFRLLYATLYIKQTGLGTFPMHQNWPILSDLNDTSVTIWVPLVAIDANNGGVCLVPGSHKLAPHINGPRTPAFYDERLPSLTERAVRADLQLGEAIIFDDSVIHGSSPNCSPALRPAMQLIFVPNDSLPVFYHDGQDGSFEMVHADTDFWIDTDFAALGQRQPDWQSVGMVESRNRRVDEAGLNALLARGAELRTVGFDAARPPIAPVPTRYTGDRRPWWRRALSAFRG